MRFLADMGVSPRVVAWLREAGHDATHLRDEGLHRMADKEIFQKAVAEDRIVVTFDLDFGDIVAHSQSTRPSVVVFRLRDTRTERVIDRLRTVLQHARDAIGMGAVVAVEDARYRIRTLPIRAQ